MIKLKQLIILIGFFCYLDPPIIYSNSSMFPNNGIIKKQSWFWEKIFDQYDSNAFVIHDINYPEIIIDIIDFNKILAHQGKRIHRNSDQRKFTDKYLERYNIGIKRFKKYGLKAYKMGAIENRLYQVYKQNTTALYDLIKGKIEVRSQMGLKDEYQRAIYRASTYLPLMEKIFISHGLPVELTRIPFVESMFNYKAKSKVGASGIWQFMPKTAKKYLKLNYLIDERNSPLKATVAAARMLRENYKRLGNWPLAITAYNYGANGLRRAVLKVKSNNLNEIIKKYNYRRFGFASQNFYSEFVAVNKVFKNRYLSKIGKEKSFKFIKVRLPKKASIHEISKRTKISLNIFKEYNYCLKPSVFKISKKRILPKNYSLFIPQRFMTKNASAYFNKGGNIVKKWSM